MEAAASTLCLSRSPGFSRILDFAPVLGYTASDNHYFDIAVRPRGLSGIQNMHRQPDAKVCSLTQLAHDWQATATSIVAETPLDVCPPQTHVQFTCY